MHCFAKILFLAKAKNNISKWKQVVKPGVAALRRIGIEWGESGSYWLCSFVMEKDR
jgi:hypothetical protein